MATTVCSLHSMGGSYKYIPLLVIKAWSSVLRGLLFSHAMYFFHISTWRDNNPNKYLHLSFQFSLVSLRCLTSILLEEETRVYWKINNPTFDVVNDVKQDFSLKYSNNKMGINDVINKMSINNTRANLLH